MFTGGVGTFGGQRRGLTVLDHPHRVRLLDVLVGVGLRVDRERVVEEGVRVHDRRAEAELERDVVLHVTVVVDVDLVLHVVAEPDEVRAAGRMLEPDVVGDDVDLRRIVGVTEHVEVRVVRRRVLADQRGLTVRGRTGGSRSPRRGRPPLRASRRRAPPVASASSRSHPSFDGLHGWYAAGPQPADGLSRRRRRRATRRRSVRARRGTASVGPSTGTTRAHSSASSVYCATSSAEVGPLSSGRTFPTVTAPVGSAQPADVRADAEHLVHRLAESGESLVAGLDRLGPTAGRPRARRRRAGGPARSSARRRPASRRPCREPRHVWRSSAGLSPTNGSRPGSWVTVATTTSSSSPAVHLEPRDGRQLGAQVRPVGLVTDLLA